MKRNTLAAYAVGLATAVTLTGCGSGFADESAADIIKAASDDMSKLKSVHIAADIATGGENITLDLTLDTDGNCTGEVGVGGGKAEVLSVDGDSWFKADETFYREQAGEQADQVLEVVGDNWVADPNGQFSSFCDLDELLKEIGDPENVEDAEKDGTEDVDGDEAVKIVGTEEGSDTTAFVATDEPHYILKVAVTGDDEGEATFSEFDEEVDAEAPAEDEIVELPGG